VNDCSALDEKTANLISLETTKNPGRDT
jgi:hypothetical protein